MEIYCHTIKNTDGPSRRLQVALPMSAGMQSKPQQVTIFSFFSTLQKVQQEGEAVEIFCAVGSFSFKRKKHLRFRVKLIDDVPDPRPFTSYITIVRTATNTCINHGSACDPNRKFYWLYIWHLVSVMTSDEGVGYPSLSL
jgi:hypothetical protein